MEEVQEAVVAVFFKHFLVVWEREGHAGFVSVVLEDKERVL